LSSPQPTRPRRQVLNPATLITYRNRLMTGLCLQKSMPREIAISPRKDAHPLTRSHVVSRLSRQPRLTTRFALRAKGHQDCMSLTCKHTLTLRSQSVETHSSESLNPQLHVSVGPSRLSSCHLHIRGCRGIRMQGQEKKL
jgi:hypothetical protein